MLCKVLKVSRQGYYKWLNKKEIKTKRSAQNENLKKIIHKIYDSSRNTYGRRRVHATFKKQGIVCGKNRVGKLMKQLHLQGRGKPKFIKTTDSRHNRRIFPNLIIQNFKAYVANSIWTSDITYIPTKEGWLYLCIVLDCYSRSIIGWSMSEKINAELVVSAIKQAISNRKPETGVVFHSDRGSQYASYAVVNILKANGFLQSMSSTGNCYDNAITESFFATLKIELIHKCNFLNRKEARVSIFEFIEVFYNRIRIHSKLDFKTPFEYEGICM